MEIFGEVSSMIDVDNCDIDRELIDTFIVFGHGQYFVFGNAPKFRPLVFHTLAHLSVM